MQPDPLDRDFHTFRQTGDPTALAAVFDAAAPRLLLVAMHLCRDAATAEDLVQTVFLQVLRDAPRFDPRRPVLPWLLAILEHRANDLRDRAHVRRERPPDGGDAATNADSPARAAAAAEVRERVAEALRGMPRDYRDVLTLRLVHGLSPRDIAHAQGLAPATVRTRLRRGLELLRGALPRGLATRGLLALLAAELALARDGMAAVRATVLAAAATGTVTTTVAGWWLVAACAAVAAAGWLWLGPATRATLGPAAPVDGTAVVAAADVEPRAAPGGSRVADDAAASSAGERRPAVDPNTTTVRGRVVDAGTGTPLTDVVAAVQTHDAGTGETDADWRDPEPVTTAADGTFAIRFVPSRHRSVELGFAAPGYVDEFTSFEPLRTGVDVDAGDVTLRRGTSVRLRLVCGGLPLGGVEAYAGSAPDGRSPAELRGFGTSDANGEIDLGCCEPGPWWHELRTAHLGAEGRFDVPLQATPFVVAVALREPPRERSISGVLVDTTGAPLASVELGLPGELGTLVTTTRADGRFLWALGAAPPPNKRERVVLAATHRDLAWVDDGGSLAWGTHDVRLVVRRRSPATLRIVVVDDATGRPVTEFGLDCTQHVCSASRRRVASAHHSAGVATRDLPPGPWFVSVFPRPPFAEHAEVPVELVEGTATELRVALRPPAELAVDVVDAAAGAPVPGVEVALAKVVPAERARELPSSWYQDMCARPWVTGTHHRGAVIVLARGTSDARGHVSFAAPADVPGLVLVASGPHCIACEQHDVALPAGGAHAALRVTPAATVHGAVTPLAFVERAGPAPHLLAEFAASSRTQWCDPAMLAREYPHVVLRALSGEGAQALVTAVAADGSFAFGGVPGGAYTVHVDASFGGVATISPPLATITATPGRDSAPCTLDLAALMPARGMVRCFVDGSAATDGVGLARVDPNGLRYHDCRLGNAAAFTTPWLLPGMYVPYVELADGGRVLGTEQFVVRPDAGFDATFTLRRRDVTVTVLDASGRHATELLLRTSALDLPGIGPSFWRDVRTDPAGRAELVAPPGRLQVHAFDPAQTPYGTGAEPKLRLLGDVAADATAATFRLP